MNIAIIQARMESQRLPGKVLMPICGQPILLHIVERLRAARYVDQIVVATAGPGAECIAGHCEAWGVECYRHHGDPDDVLGRFLAVLDAHPETRMVIRACADSPMLDPFALDQQAAVFTALKAIKAGCDYCGWTDGDGGFIHANGIFAECVCPDALRSADVLATREEREHVTAAIYHRPQSFFCRWLSFEALAMHPKYSTGMAIDTRADYERVRALMEEST